MKRVNLIIMSFCVLVSVFIACSDDGDTTKPVITLQQPADGAEIIIGGDGIFVIMDLEDNEMLATYTINIHDTSDGHDHANKTKAEELNYFSYNRSWNVSDENTLHVEHEIDIPEGVEPGKYHFVILCIDEAGNETRVYRDIFLVEPENV